MDKKYNFSLFDEQLAVSEKAETFSSLFDTILGDPLFGKGKNPKAAVSPAQRRLSAADKPMFVDTAYLGDDWLTGCARAKSGEKQAVMTAGMVVDGPVSVQTDIRINGVINGDVDCTGSLLLQGTVHGNIRCEGNVEIGANAVVEGDVRGAAVRVAGRVTGHVSASQHAEIAHGAVVEGSLCAPGVQVDAGAFVEGGIRLCSAERETGGGEP